MLEVFAMAEVWVYGCDDTDDYYDTIDNDDDSDD